MFDAIRRPVLRLLRVPHDPDPPVGAPGSLRVFRAGRNFYKLRLLGWGAGQVAALVGILFSVIVLTRFHSMLSAARAEPAPRNATTKAGPPPSPPALRRVAETWPGWVFPVITVAEIAGILVYLIQIPVTYALARLDYELRWYMVTDRSLRIRAGLTSVLETTMSFANVQQVAVTQGPLQRLLGLADVRVQSAGGGGGRAGAHEGRSAADSLHTGVFRGVDNATEIRDLILERLRQFRAAGLGDPEDEPLEAQGSVTRETGEEGDALVAARELLAEARGLRHAVEKSVPPT